MILVIPVELYQRLRAYILNTPYEISGLGKIRVVGEEITVEDIQIFQQTVTTGSTTLDRHALAKFYDSLILNGENLAMWKLWFHSHAFSDVFWSSIDEATIEDFDSELPTNNWMVSLVMNHAGHILIRVDVFAPLRITVDDIKWRVATENLTIEEEVKQEIAEKVVVATVRQPKPNNQIDWNPHNQYRIENGRVVAN